jgi:hypothetical protein
MKRYKDAKSAGKTMPLKHRSNVFDLAIADIERWR